MNEAAKPPSPNVKRIASVDGAREPEKNDPFRLRMSDGFRALLERLDATIALTTYEAGKIVALGPKPQSGFNVTERNFDRAMALLAEGSTLYLSTLHQIWRFENAIKPETFFQGHDRLYLPRSCHFTGAVDVHDVHRNAEGRTFACVTLYNCIAEIDWQGSFNPLWRPPFVTAMAAGDRCHVNGFCLIDGAPRYATLIAETDVAGAWREKRADGGAVYDLCTDKPVVRGLAMPHSPRWARSRLWLAEAGSGWFGSIDPQAGKFERLLWMPGFLRGVRIFGDLAFVGLSKPRNLLFSGLPLDDELKRRGEEPVCGVNVVDLKAGKVVETIRIDGSVKEIYDIALLNGCRRPLIIGVQGEDVRRLVALGPDRTGGAPAAERLQ